MQIIDTHTHLYLDQFDVDRDEVIARARQEGVQWMLLPNIDSQSIAQVKDVVSKFPETKPMWGLHPCHIFANWKDELATIELLIDEFPPVAIGEIGLDYFWSLDFKSEQKQALTHQLQWALQRNLPVSLHTREATSDVIQLVEPFAKQGLTGVFHCFSGTRVEAERIIDFGFRLGIGGNITFKKNPVRDFIGFLPLHSIVLETDSPYLAPVPFRGKRNEPGHLIFVVEELSKLFRVDKEEITNQTYRTSKEIFHL